MKENAGVANATASDCHFWHSRAQQRQPLNLTQVEELRVGRRIASVNVPLVPATADLSNDFVIAFAPVIAPNPPPTVAVLQGEDNDDWICTIGPAVTVMDGGAGTDVDAGDGLHELSLEVESLATDPSCSDKMSAALGSAFP